MTVDLRVALDRIRDDFGRVTGDTVLAAARADGDPYGLHDRFNWDDASAAHAHRLRQARELVRRYHVVYRQGTETEGPRRIRAYHSLPDEEGRAYYPAQEVAENPVSRQILLAEMERDWRAFKRRWGHFVEFVQMVTADLSDEAAA